MPAFVRRKNSVGGPRRLAANERSLESHHNSVQYTESIDLLVISQRKSRTTSTRRRNKRFRKRDLRSRFERRNVFPQR